MKLNILAFGITKEIIGNTMLEYQLEEGASVEDLKAALMKSYPKMCDLANIMIAVNSSYAVNGQDS